MFLLYAVVAGIGIGLLLGGRLSGLAALEIRWPAAIVGGLLVQVVLFSPPVAARVGGLGPVLYVASTMLVGAAVLRNWRVPGIPLVVVGAACNLAAILANGGSMPAGRAAIELMGGPGAAIEAAYSNSSIVADPALWFLTDIFALPRWVPFANVFSVGDLLIATGIALVIVLAMRSARGVDGRRGTGVGRARCAAEPPPNGRTRLVPVGDPLRSPKALRSGRGPTGILHRGHRPGQTRREAGTQSQGSSPRRPPGCRGRDASTGSKESHVKANLARFIWAVALLASMALSIGAGIRWDWG